MSTEKIVNLLRGLATLCLAVGIIGAILGLFLVDGGVILITPAAIVSGLIGYVTYHAMANIMEDIHTIAVSGTLINKKMDNANNADESSHTSNESNTNTSSGRLDLSRVSSGGSGSTWKCPKCGEFNSITSRTCRGCGYQK